MGQHDLGSAERDRGLIPERFQPRKATGDVTQTICALSLRALIIDWEEKTAHQQAANKRDLLLTRSNRMRFGEERQRRRFDRQEVTRHHLSRLILSAIMYFIVHYMGRRAASVCSPLVRETGRTAKCHVRLANHRVCAHLFECQTSPRNQGAPN
jgi:hypothetical protein